MTAEGLEFKVRARKRGRHMEARVWAGPSGRTLALLGVLRMTFEEWTVFEALLVAGQQRLPAEGIAKLTVETEGPALLAD